MDWWRNRKKHKALQSYATKLGPGRVRRYRRLEQYTVRQVERTARDLHLDFRFLAYAIALFRYDESKNTRDRYRLDQRFIDLLRKELAEAFFDGDLRYSTSHVLKLSAPRAWKGGRPGVHPYVSPGLARHD